MHDFLYILFVIVGYETGKFLANWAWNKIAAMRRDRHARV